MIFDSLDFHLVTPTEAPLFAGAAAVASLALRLEGAAELSPHCSGVLVSSRHLLTAAHCVHPQLVLNPRYLAVRSDADGLKVLGFGSLLRVLYEGATLARLEDSAPPPLGEPLYRNPILDFAIFALAEPTASGFIDLKVESMPAERWITAGEPLNLYGYPNGIPLSRSSGCHTLQSPLPDVVLHDCDSLTGLSGGLLVSATCGAPVALHLGSSNANDYTYFKRTGHFESPGDFHAEICEPAPRAPDAAPRCFPVRGYNRALTLHAVARTLEEEAPALWAEICGAR